MMVFIIVLNLAEIIIFCTFVFKLLIHTPSKCFFWGVEILNLLTADKVDGPSLYHDHDTKLIVIVEIVSEMWQFLNF